MTERTAQTVKRLLMIAKKSGSDPYLALLELRNTPLGGLGSPVQLLYGRRTRTVLPEKVEANNNKNRSNRKAMNRTLLC